MNQPTTNDPGAGDWNRIVKDARKEKAEEYAHPPPPPRRRGGGGGWVLPLLLAAAVVAVGLQLQGTLSPWPPGPSTDDDVKGQLVALQLTARAVHDYAVFHGGRYPARLQDVLQENGEVQYSSNADGFELRATGSDGSPLVLRSH